MSTRNRIPATLEPYLRLPPEASLILLTSTLGCSANWLTARFVGSLLGQNTSVSPESVGGTDHGKETAVVLVSFMRDAAFWKNETRRTTGVDISKLSESRRYTFVDCFISLRDHSADSALSMIEKAITSAITAASQSRSHDVTLLLDNPDVLLVLTLASAQQLSDFVLKLRALVHATVLVCCADLPLLSAATSTSEKVATPVEVDSAAFIVQQAHSARYVMSVRELQTGAARDVSGVLRVTMGGDVCDWEREDVREVEALYLVQRDGNAKVFERGAASV